MQPTQKLVEVLPRGLCSMCQHGTTKWRECPTCKVHNCQHLATEHERRCKEVNRV
jgi:hypothetical protein